MSCGHVAMNSGAQFCSEDCMLEAHDQAHSVPEEWADECSICMERVEDAFDDLPEDGRETPGVLPRQGQFLKTHGRRA